MNRTQSLLLLIVFSLLVLVPGMTRIPILDRDSALFAQASKQIVETNDPWRIQVQDKPRQKKPPGIYWLQATSAKLFSPQHLNIAWPYRLPSLLCALFAVLMTYAFAKNYFSSRTAFTAALFLASSILMIAEAHMATTDAALLATIVLMQGSLWRLYQPPHENQSNSLWIMSFWLAMALGIFIKGIAPIFAVLTILSLCIWDRSLRCLKVIKPILGLTFLIAFNIAWVAAFYHATHSNFILNMLRSDFLPKLSHGMESHGAPPGYYFVLLPLTLWPGILFFWQGAINAWQQRQQLALRFCLAWIIPAWLVFELAPTKLPHYTLPLYPPIVILLAHAIETFDLNSCPRWGKFLIALQTGVWTLVSFTLIGITVLLPFYLTRQFSLPLTMISSILIVLIGVVLQYKQDKPYRSVAVMALCSFLLLAPTLQFTLPRIHSLWITDKIVTTLQTKAANAVSDRRPLITTDYNEVSLIFELGTHKVEYRPLPMALDKIDKRHQQIYLVAKQQLEPFKTYLDQQQINWQKIATISGFYYTKGKWISLILLRIG